MQLTTWTFQIPDAPSSAAWSLAWAGARATWRSRKLVAVVAIVVLAAELTIALMLFGIPVVPAVALAPVAAVLLLAVTSVGVWRRDIRHPSSRVLATPVTVAASRAKRRGGVEVWQLSQLVAWNCHPVTCLAGWVRSTSGTSSTSGVRVSVTW
ncbi:hypothetical protein ATY41_05605 [Leifsonia xyli subsp. xyli]|uniref:Integral membrane protein n=2 Tax=Leifsonia xyli subsp. xyli TaxID=59736 RepID=Q6AEU0_LEIXX|nr:hypothetical protein [Leifsonia xyli]AAT89105.1 integral membrane protein [Leifsonia xyli subsp. xyli str. CTCB07]ODA89390.1 hypothetical protein ATY41_05605 [Leifsonia xyli subsp. xyli]